MRIYALSVARWENPIVVHRDELFHALAASRSGKVRLWLAEHDGAAVAGAICLYQGATVAYWHGALDAAHQELRPATFLHAHVMRCAAEAGYRWYDFGPSGGQGGVMQFKQRFGAAERDVNSLVHHAPLKRRLHQVRGALKRG
jgi:lipid II:glycine glycyltransferase (peptidoglycan interpeptide bridge formation enzyme)